MVNRKIVKLTKSEFDYEAVRGSGVEVEGKFILTCPVGTVFPLYRTTRSKAEDKKRDMQQLY